MSSLCCSCVFRFCFSRGTVAVRTSPFVLLVCGQSTVWVWRWVCLGALCGTVPWSFAGSVGVDAFVCVPRVLLLRVKALPSILFAKNIIGPAEQNQFPRPVRHFHRTDTIVVRLFDYNCYLSIISVEQIIQRKGSRFFLTALHELDVSLQLLNLVSIELVLLLQILTPILQCLQLLLQTHYLLDQQLSSTTNNNTLSPMFLSRLFSLHPRCEL